MKATTASPPASGFLADNPNYAAGFGGSDRRGLLEGNPNYGSQPSQSRDSHDQNHSAQQVVKSAKSRGVYIILGLFFGFLGVHNFYAGYLGRGLAQFLVVAILGWFVVGFVIVFIWIVIEFFIVTHDSAGDRMV